jgi:hypothetical protein
VIHEPVGEKNCVPEQIGSMEYSSVLGWDENGVERKKNGQGWRELVGESKNQRRIWDRLMMSRRN